MIGLTSDITDEVSFGRRDNICIPVHRWSKYDKVPCLGAQGGVRTRNVIITAQ